MKKRIWVFSLLLALLAATALLAAGCGEDVSAQTTAQSVSTTAPAVSTTAAPAQPATTEAVGATEAVAITAAAPAT
ncbi:MAG: tungsten ABC transporter substrate-binding protein, partial [Actinobacteria bacterium]|nr:tungsten ABC transporter substrate-binding protein [Actinomycetota bacterium]